MSTVPERAVAAAEPSRFSPGDLDAERRVLGILIKYPGLVDVAMDRLRPHHFYEPVHRRIFELIHALYAEQGRISYTQLYNALRKDGSIDSPDQWLIGLTEAFVSE
ncbi:MAG TPA: DnaB-like helicase N-terminal domain-containing protein, partial [Limnochordia bacterium]